MRQFTTIACLALMLLLTSRLTADVGPQSIPDLIQQLDDAEFARREAAVDSLATYGVEVIEPLVAAARDASPEVASRSVRLLEMLLESSDPADIDAADDALVSLTESDNPQASSLAAAVLIRNSPIREERAVQQIKDLGGQVQYGRPPISAFGGPIGGFPDDPHAPPELVPRIILLGRSWTGGVEGLEHFRKLTHLQHLEIYVEKGSNVPLEKAQSLASVLPGLTVHHRGPYLGVGQTTTGAEECIIGSVKPGGPAEKAGLQPRDLVLAVDDQQVRSFHDLVDELKDYAPGDTVRISVQRLDPQIRQNRLLEIPVELGAWNLEPIADGLQP